MTCLPTHLMPRLLLASFAVLLALGGGATAQTPVAAPALKASVTITGDVVRIGDLVDNAGPVADVPIFRAPDLGTTGAVATSRILDAIRPHQLIGIDTHGLNEVTVTRASRAINAREISGRIAQALSGQFGLGDAQDIQINFEGEVRTLQAEPSATGELQVVSLYYDPRSARFDVSLSLPTSAALHRAPARYVGTAIETVAALAVDRPVERGELVKADDLTVIRRPKAQGNAFLSDPAAAAGLAARHALRPGQPLAAADLMKPEVVQRSDTVTIVFEAPGLTLTLRGQAQEPGALGDTIAVLNLESKRTVQALVTGPDRVTVNPIAKRFVENSAGRSE